jgi:hypothetical protein
MNEIRLKLPPEILERLQEAAIGAGEATGVKDYPVQAVALAAILQGLEAVEREVLRQSGGPQVHLRIVK